MRQVYELSYRAALKIRAARFQPDIIVAIARGGFAPARFLCDFLHVTDMASVQVKHYEAGADKQAKARIKHPLNADVQGKKVLLADDVNDTGDSLKVAKQHILGFKAAEVKIAVMHQKSTTAFPADFYSGYVSQWRWIIYPWAMVEDAGSFLKKMKPFPKSDAEAVKRLKDEHGLMISKQQVRKIFRLTCDETRFFL